MFLLLKHRIACRRGRPAATTDQADPVRAERRGRRRAPLEVVANFVLFVPFGVYLGLLAPTWRWWTWTGVLLGASFVLETTQHLSATGSFDTTDMIVNTLGGLAGVGLLAMACRNSGTDRCRHDQGLPDRHRGVAARDRDLRRLHRCTTHSSGMSSSPHPPRHR